MSKLQIVKELHRPARKRIQRRRVQMRGIGDTYQIDLVEMIPYARENRQHKYILTIIDIFSKYAWALPVKNKTSACIVNIMRKFLSTQRVPRNIHSDMGKEFYNMQFQQLMSQYNINHYSTYTSMKASIVERFNRTLKNKMWQKFHMQGTHKWLAILPKLLRVYNDTKHRTIHMKPVDVSEQDEKRLLQTVYKYVTTFDKSHDKFKINDYVRISKFKSLFEKGYMPNWTTEIFQISKIQYTQPITYLLKDLENNEIKGAFYAEELQKTANPHTYLIEKIIRRGHGDRLYVKWLGFDSSHNSWINKKDFF